MKKVKALLCMMPVGLMAMSLSLGRCSGKKEKLPSQGNSTGGQTSTGAAGENSGETSMADGKNNPASTASGQGQGQNQGQGSQTPGGNHSGA